MSHRSNEAWNSPNYGKRHYSGGSSGAPSKQESRSENQENEDFNSERERLQMEMGLMMKIRSMQEESPQSSSQEALEEGNGGQMAEPQALEGTEA